MKEGQVFGIITYDALFKWVLSSDSVRPSFFHAFIPGIVVRSSERLDDHMNPLQELQVLRGLINAGDTKDLVSSLKQNHSDLKVHLADAYHEKATKFMKELLHHFDDIQYSFPKPSYNGTMDFVCKLDTGEFALIEMQITPEQKDWLLFLKDAHNMTEEDVKRQIRTPAVLEAFERAKLISLPRDVKEHYHNQEVHFENMSSLFEEQLQKGEAIGLKKGEVIGLEKGEAKVKQEIAKVAKALLTQGVAISIIESTTGLSSEEIKKLQ